MFSGEMRYLRETKYFIKHKCSSKRAGIYWPEIYFKSNIEIPKGKILYDGKLCSFWSNDKFSETFSLKGKKVYTERFESAPYGELIFYSIYEGMTFGNNIFGRYRLDEESGIIYLLSEEGEKYYDYQYNLYNRGYVSYNKDVEKKYGRPIIEKDIPYINKLASCYLVEKGYDFALSETKDGHYVLIELNKAVNWEDLKNGPKGVFA